MRLDGKLESGKVLRFINEVLTATWAVGFKVTSFWDTSWIPTNWTNFRRLPPFFLFIIKNTFFYFLWRWAKIQIASIYYHKVLLRLSFILARTFKEVNYMGFFFPSIICSSLHLIFVARKCSNLVVPLFTDGSFFLGF